MSSHTLPSFACSTWPIGACLEKVEQLVGERMWVPINEIQSTYLRALYYRTRGVNLDVVESMASFSAQEVVNWLAKRGFTIEIEPFNPLQFGLASVLDVLLRWIEGNAERHTISSGDGSERAGVKIHGHIPFFKAEGHSEVVIEVPNRDEKTHVYMTILENPPTDEFGLVRLARQLSMTRTPLRLRFHGVIFPMIHLEEKRDLDWIVGLRMTNGGNPPLRIHRAVQMVRLRMNEQGVRAQSAAVMTMRAAGAPPVPFVINRPFLLWIERDGVDEPLYTAWLNYDSWKNPGGLT